MRNLPAVNFKPPEEYSMREGDIIFQENEVLAYTETNNEFLEDFKPKCEKIRKRGKNKRVEFNGFVNPLP